MKKQLIALAVCGAFCGLAQAEGGSVTVYGIVDAGLMTQSKTTGAPTTTATGTTYANAGSATGFVDAQMLPSIYGFKGTEDLGGGLKAGFTLEGGLDTANGLHNSPGVLQTQIFGREAKLTLGGDWGTVAAGLQLDPAFAANLGTEPRGDTDALSSLEHWIFATFANGSGPGSNGVTLQGGIFDANSISYTYAGNGLYVGALYGFGGIAGSSSANSQYSLGASYSTMGITVAAGYVEDKANVPATATTSAYTGANSEIWHVGAGYEFGQFAVRLQYSEFKFNYNPLNGSAGDVVKDIGVGFDWKVGANKLNLAYYNSKDTGAAKAAELTGFPLGGKTNEWAIADFYSLSKRTTLYAQLAGVKADQDAGDSAALGGIYVTNAGGLAALPGATTTYFGLGVQHTF